MATESEVKLARYQQIEKEVDGFGRIIGVRRLKPSEQTKVAGMTTDLTGHDVAPVQDPETGEGLFVNIPHRAPLILVASVCLIGESPIPFARNRAELDAVYDRLDVEGLMAAAKAMNRLNETEIVAEPLVEAKN